MARPHLSLLKHQEVAIAYYVGLCHANWCNSSSSALSKNPHVLPPYWGSQLYKVRALVSSIRSYEPTPTVKSHSFIHMLRSSMCWHYVRSIEAQSFDSNCNSQPPLWGRIQSGVYEGAIWHLTRERAKFTSTRIVSVHQCDQFQSCPLDNAHIMESGNEVFVVLVGVLRVSCDEVHQEWHHWITFEIVWKVSYQNPEWLNHCTVWLHDETYCLDFLSDFFSWLVGHNSLVQVIVTTFRGSLICLVGHMQYGGSSRMRSAHCTETWLCLKISEQQL